MIDIQERVILNVGGLEVVQVMSFMYHLRRGKEKVLSHDSLAVVLTRAKVEAQEGRKDGAGRESATE